MAAGYRVPPPARDALIRWPASFGTRFCLFVDAEEEFDWRAPLSRDARSVKTIAALPDAHRRFARWGVPVAYMVDHPVATDGAAAEHLRAVLAQGGAAIGAQLHGWVNPPFGAGEAARESYAGALPRATEAAKIDALTSAIERSFAARPLAFRSGRYGIGENTAALLAERGYRIDSSVRALYDYSSQGGPDFRAIGAPAYWADRERTLLELPLTTMFTGRWRRNGARLHDLAGRMPRGRGALARLGLLSRVALTPEDMPLGDAIAAARAAVGEGVKLLNFAFHSPTLTPGHTPYTRNAAELDGFWRWWGGMLDELARLGVRAASLAEVIAAADASG